MMSRDNINLYLNYDSSIKKCLNFTCLISSCLIKMKDTNNDSLTEQIG